MKKIIYITFCLLAAVFVYLAPDRYNYEYCLIILLVFLGINIFHFTFSRSPNKNSANFDFFFMFSYGMTNFIYPVFYKTTNPDISLFSLSFDYHVISKSTAIALLGYTFFLLGLTFFRKVKKQQDTLQDNSQPEFKINNLFLRIIFVIGIAAFMGYITTGGLTELQKVYSGRGGNLNTVGVYSYFNNIFVICCNLLAIFVLLIQDKKTKVLTFIFLIICSLLLLATGSRTVVLGIGLILVAVYGRYIKRISIIRLLFFILIGSFVMTLIQLSRSQEFSGNTWANNVNNNVEFENFFDIFLDLIINNRNLYVLVEFADRRGFVYFLSTISDITAPIPGLFGYISNSMGVPQELIFGGALPTFLEFGKDSEWGLGTNLVGETYVGFGFFGVCIIMFLLGLIINKTQIASNRNIYSFVIYYLLVSHAVFFPRAFYLYQPRTIVWSLIIVALVLKFSNSFYKSKKVKT